MSLAWVKPDFLLTMSVMCSVCQLFLVRAFFYGYFNIRHGLPFSALKFDWLSIQANIEADAVSYAEFYMILVLLRHFQLTLGSGVVTDFLCEN